MLLHVPPSFTAASHFLLAGITGDCQEQGELWGNGEVTAEFKPLSLEAPAQMPGWK